MAGLFSTAASLTPRVLAGPIGVGSMVLQGVVEGGSFLAAEAIKAGGDVNDGASIARRTVEGTLKADKLMEDMRRNAEAIRIFKQQEGS